MSETPTDSTPKPTNRRLFRWLLATLVVVVIVTLFAIGLPIYRDRQAARKWEQLGGYVLWGSPSGEVYYESSSHHSPFSLPSEDSLWDRIEYRFRHVVQAEHLGRGVDAKQILPIIAEFNQLKFLDLSLTRLSADDLRQIVTNQPNLTGLALGACEISDEGLREIGQLYALKDLFIRGGTLTDEGLAHLQHLENLETLILTKVDVTDEGVWQLRTLKKLENITVSKTQVTDAGIKRLRGVLPGLKVWDE